MKLVKLLANLGYGSRKEAQRLIRSGAVTDDTGSPLGEGELPPHERIRFRGEPLDPPFPLTIMLNKPDGYTCSSDDPGSTVYDLLPERFAHRNPGSIPSAGSTRTPPVCCFSPTTASCSTRSSTRNPAA
jgi:16S rRNA pseudouridine516 synthase